MLASKLAIVTGSIELLSKQANFLKIVLLLGGGSGIGQEICKKLAASGARLIVADLRKSAADNTTKILTGSGHSSFKMDVSKADDVGKLQKFIRSSGSSPSILVNCAGVTKAILHISKIPQGLLF